jgi:hypothetical protein
MVQEWAVQRENLDRAKFQQMVIELEHSLEAMQQTLPTLSEEELEIVREAYSDVIAAEAAVSDASVAFFIKIPKLPIPNFIPHFPGLPDFFDPTHFIPGWGVIHDIPDVLVPDFLEDIKDKVEGVVGGVYETIEEIVEGFVEQVLFVLKNFLDRLWQVAKHIAKGQLDQAFVGLFLATVRVFEDAVVAVAAIVVNFLNDAILGVLGGFLFGRPLNADERAVARRVFGDKINITLVRIVDAFNPLDKLINPGMVSANVIYMTDTDMSDPETRALLAHELTHIYQDQNDLLPGTTTATREQIAKILYKHNPYDLELTADTNWLDLGAEAQGKLVERYYEYLEGVPPGKQRSVNSSELVHFERILREAGLFESDL